MFYFWNKSGYVQFIEGCFFARSDGLDTEFRRVTFGHCPGDETDIAEGSNDGFLADIDLVEDGVTFL